MLKPFSLAACLLLCAIGTAAQQHQPAKPDHMQHKFDDPARYAKSFDDPARDALADAGSRDRGAGA